MRYLLAADGGGTKTHVICADETGQVLGEGFSGPTSLAVVTPGAASFNLREAVRQALQVLPDTSQISVLYMGLAGMDTHAEAQTARNVFQQVLQDFPILRLELVNDSVIALASGSQAADALVLISGTGSNCFGRNSLGETAKAGGLDFLLTDQGSGYAIGRSVLRTAIKSYDGRIPHTELEQYVCEHFRIASMAEIKDKVHQPLLSKTEVAEVAQLCLRAFDQGDEMAKQIFDRTISDLGCMAQAVLKKLDVLGKPVECVLAGSITKIAYIQKGLEQELLGLCPEAKVIVPTTAPVHGAVVLGVKELAALNQPIE